MSLFRMAKSGTGFVMGLLLGVTLPVLAAPSTSKVTNLLTMALAEQFTPGREVLVDRVELGPNQKLDWHYHPGEEFHYYLAGDPVIELEGEAPILGKPGGVGHVPFHKRHRATAGAKGATVIVFRVHPTGQPWRYLDPPAVAKPDSN